MSRFTADLKAFGKMYMRSKGGMFFTFILPILLIALFGSMFSAETSTISLPVQNLDGSASSVAFMDALNHTGVVQLQVIPSDVDFDAYVKDNSLTMALQIPQNFSANLAQKMADPNASMAYATMYGDPSKSTYQMAQGAVSGAVVAVNFNIAHAQPVVAVRSESLPNTSGYNYMDFFLPGVIGMTVMSVSLYSMTSICSTYRSKGYFKLLSTTTIRKYEWMSTKFVVYSIMLVASLLVSYTVGVTAFGMTSPLTPLTFAFILAGTFLFIALGMLLGTVIKDEETGMAISNAIGFPMMFLSGSFFPVESFPGFLQGVAKFLPLTYLNNGLRDTMVYGNDIAALGNLAVVLVIGVVLAVAASRLMSWKEN
jgi:ABC-2 type transport system permease protein